MSSALRIAIVGAESTGKSTLTQALAGRIASLTGQRCIGVVEWLRQWCEQQGRTPRPDEQKAIALHQHRLIDEATASHDVVVCDTTALMTAVYSDLLFDDRSLVPYAIEQQRRCGLTLLTALDIPWVADGLQRDGPQVQLPVDNRLRALLIGHHLPWALVAGQGDARVEAAVDAVAPLLRARGGMGGIGSAASLGSSGSAEASGDGPTPSGLFSRLAQRDAQPAARRWMCNDCDVPDCEHRLMNPG